MTQDTLFLMQEIVKKPNKEHAHEISDINGLQDALDLKVEHPHFHEVEDINSLQGLLDDIDWRFDTHTHVSQEITDLKSAILDMVYPIGAIYISMSNTHPNLLFGGEWNQIVDTFLYCANSAGGSGGSKKITVENLPPHTHTFTGNTITGEFKTNSEVGPLRGRWCLDTETGETNCFKLGQEYPNHSSPTESGTGYGIKLEITPSGTISNTGSGTDYMPPYMNVNAWIRTA